MSNSFFLGSLGKGPPVAFPRQAFLSKHGLVLRSPTFLLALLALGARSVASDSRTSRALTSCCLGLGSLAAPQWKERRWTGWDRLVLQLRRPLKRVGEVRHRSNSSRSGKQLVLGKL